MGKHRQFLSDNFRVFPDNLDSLKNGNLLFLFIDHNSSISKTITAAEKKATTIVQDHSFPNVVPHQPLKEVPKQRRNDHDKIHKLLL